MFLNVAIIHDQRIILYITAIKINKKISTNVCNKMYVFDTDESKKKACL